MTTRHRLLIAPDGTLQFVYTDALRALLKLGTAQIIRASHVEPTAASERTADLSPVHGPRLGPFPTRAEALQAERAWLDAHPETWRTPACRAGV